MEKAENPNVRFIDLIHIADGGIRHVCDDGCDIEGRPNQQRQHLLHLLKKRYVKKDVDVPLFRLREMPKPIQYTGTKARTLQSRDTLDREVLRDDSGKPRTPDAEWLKISQSIQEKRKRETEKLEEFQLANAGKDVAEIVQSLMGLADKTSKRRQSTDKQPAKQSLGGLAP